MARVVTSRPFTTSIRLDKEPIEIHPELKAAIAPQATPLTQEILERLWKSMLDEHAEEGNFLALLGSVRLRCDDGDHFSIVADSPDFEQAVAPVKQVVVDYLRQRTHNEQLQGRVEINVAKKVETPYFAGQKYADMLAQNPVLERMRKLFPHIDL